MSFLHYCRASIPPFRAYTNATTSNLQRLTAMVANYFWTTYSTLIRSYVALISVFLIVMLSLVMPDFSQKLHRTNELKAMKKVLQVMSVSKTIEISGKASRKGAFHLAHQGAPCINLTYLVVSFAFAPLFNGSGKKIMDPAPKNKIRKVARRVFCYVPTCMKNMANFETTFY